MKTVIESLKEKFKALRDIHPAQKYIGINNNAQIYSANGNLQWVGVMQYEFINLGNQPVMVNNYFLDRYYSGSITNPTVIAGSNNKWAPLMKAGEIDNTLYTLEFLTGYYGVAAASAAPRLLVVVKQWMPTK